MAPETRMKIEQAMKELNYIPNELARSMFKQKAGIVAMLVPDIRHPFQHEASQFLTAGKPDYTDAASANRC